MISIIILAAGEQKRWSEDYPKQLAMVCNEPIIRRTIRQVMERVPVLPVVVTHDRDISIKAMGVTSTFRPNAHRFLVETLRNAQPLWGERTIVLLGDVVFSNELISEILAYDGEMCFYGNLGELFALTFTRKRQRALDISIERVYNHFHQHNEGMLWHLYRALCGFPLMQHAVDKKLLRRVDGLDYTNDVDTWDEYCAILKRVKCND